MVRRSVANHLCRHAIVPKSLQNSILSYPAKAGVEGTSGVDEKFSGFDVGESMRPAPIYFTVLLSSCKNIMEHQ